MRLAIILFLVLPYFKRWGGLPGFTKVHCSEAERRDLDRGGGAKVAVIAKAGFGCSGAWERHDLLVGRRVVDWYGMVGISL